MRNFIISAVCLAVIAAACYCFFSYASTEAGQMNQQIDTIVTHISEGKWDIAKAKADSFAEQWKEYRTPASFFLDSKPLNEIDCTLEKTLYYIYAEDYSNSTGELAYLKESLLKLHGAEKITPENIF